ncbi:MAG: argininosuccinate synthase [Candidatus Levybacteria bacterium]|nr:argininosuccinate synthase [Candidatus Levybacteria bacterium]
MNSKTKYKKAASYEAEIGKYKKVLLLYSGGLDTSVILKWLQDTYGVEVITLTADLGQQHDNLKAIQKKALKLGAKDAIVLDLKEEFANEYLAKGIKANASYQGDYHLSTPMGRAILAKKCVEIAQKLEIEVIAHGCTGKGNDQVRFEGYILTHNPEMKIIAPVREWNMDRNEEIKYAKKHGIEIPVSVNSPYSDDDNMWGMTWEGGEIEDPEIISPIEKFLTTYTLAKNAPEKEEIVKITFKKGIPVKLNGKSLSLAKIIIELNKLAGQHGVGVTHMFEDRLVGVKNGGVYEQPGAHVIIQAHKALEKYVCTRTLNELKESMDSKWGYLCYGALWFDPAMNAISAFNDQVNEKVTGEIGIRLYKGNITIVTIKSKFGLLHASFNNNEGYDFNVNASAGFIEIYSLQMKLANQIR